MLVVNIQIWPFGEAIAARTIHTIEIGRTTLHQDPETYTVRLLGPQGQLVKSDTVVEHYYADGALELVRRACEVLVLEGENHAA